MRRLLFLYFAVGSCAVLGDVGIRQGNTYVGPARDIDCLADGGLYCQRDAGQQIARIRCVGATASEPGCITPSAQTFAGVKTWTGAQRIVGTVHASLTACSSGLKGTWQTCTGHNAPVFCDGTNNIELVGTSAGETILHSVHINGLMGVLIGGVTTSASTGWTISALAGAWRPGTGAGSVPFNATHAGGTCTCTIDCDVPGGRTACTGNCTVAASTDLVFFRGTSTCTLDPVANGSLDLMGTRP